MRTFEEFLANHYKNTQTTVEDAVVNEEPTVSEEVVVANDIKNDDNIVDKIEKKSGYFFKSSRISLQTCSKVMSRSSGLTKLMLNETI